MKRYSHASRIETARCTIGSPAGDFCDADSAPDMPFAICAPHALTLYRRMHQMVTEVQTNFRDHMDIHAAAVEGVRQERYEQNNSANHRVYYLRIGDRIKIGMTGRLKQRIASYPPGTELLATEVGGEELESRRLRQFQHLLADRKEWFHPGSDLLEHIASLSKAA